VNLLNLKEFKQYLSNITVNIGLERVDTQKEVTAEIPLDSSITYLIINSKFTKNSKFKLKKKERSIYIKI